jgi:hypothetical protein
MAVTRDVALDAVRDLLIRPKRASIAFLDGDPVAIVPVALRFVGDRPLVRLPVRGADLSGREIVVLSDDGPWWFQLRGVSFRGTAERVEEEGDSVWWAITPRRTLSWDYGAVREE